MLQLGFTHSSGYSQSAKKAPLKVCVIKRHEGFTNANIKYDFKFVNKLIFNLLFRSFYTI